MKLETLAAFFLLASLLPGQSVTQQRARLRGGGGPDGKCTIEVDVDDIAEVEVFGDTGRMSTLSGAPAVWRRFECSSPMPPNMHDFRFSGVDGRGRQVLVRDPRNNRGRAVVRIEDNRGGREGYTFDLEWRGSGGPTFGPGPGGPVGPGGPPGGPPYGGPRPNRITVERAISVCQDAVVGRLERDGYRGVRFERIAPDNNPGRNDWVIGTAEARRRDYKDSFSFSCSVDFSNGRVRNADVRRR